ncbi:hypothetical protein PM082_017299 [Marasmius tenuissimus]|nr:hypothetical protein PM082_017299 [Marasmius tenuissimus]
MPLDGQQYLVSQGWSGKGTGLRAGAITRPIAVSQKKTLAGLGKDRDEAFPFWDHLFSAASKSIQVKISNDSDDSSTDTADDTSVPLLKRTTTGILSNRRPTSVTPATTSGASTPATPQMDGPKLSLIALAKREAAKRNLYSRFYRGPILGPDTSEERSTSRSSTEPPTQKAEVVDTTHQKNEDTEKEARRSKKKRKAEELEKEERRERKRRKKELKQLEKLEKRAKKQAKKDSSAAEEEAPECVDKAERRKRKEEKRRRREEKSVRKAQSEGTVVTEHISENKDKTDIEGTKVDTLTKPSCKHLKKRDEVLEGECTFPKAKKKRRTGE